MVQGFVTGGALPAPPFRAVYYQEIKDNGDPFYVSRTEGDRLPFLSSRRRSR